jgi:hypothetical protein
VASNGDSRRVEVVSVEHEAKQMQASFAGWNFTAIWQFDAAISAFPSLRFESGP